MTDISELREIVQNDRDESMQRMSTTARAAENSERPSSKANYQNMTFTYQDIEQRQRLIDRLLGELETRSEAVKKIGNDLVQAREKNLALERKVDELERQVRDNDAKTMQLINSVDLDVLSESEMRRRYALLAHKLQSETAKSKDLSSKLEEAQHSNIQKNEMEKKFLELRQAHTAQQAYVQKLQSSLEKSSKYKSALKKQETIIAKLEALLKDGVSSDRREKVNLLLRSAKDAPELFDDNIYKMLVDENRQLKERIFELEEQVESSAKKLQNESKPIGGSETSAGNRQIVSEEEYLKLLMKAETGEVRIAALEAELAKNARVFAQQLADLKQQVADKDAKIRLGSRSPVPSEYHLHLRSSSRASSASNSDGGYTKKHVRLPSSKKKPDVHLEPLKT
ncbi:Coiled-coil domain-containing protein 33 [Chytridiales sp. JEL 0842]|nr:Coiled-coil domain-containing protein 33 [Chytridiales sp. JEL 0842]